MEVDKTQEQVFMVKAEFPCVARWNEQAGMWEAESKDLRLKTYAEDYVQAAEDLKRKIGDNLGAWDTEMEQYE